jgi:hypothetical protein
MSDGLRQVLRQADARVTLVVAVVGALLGAAITDRPVLWALVWTAFGIIAVAALALASQPEQQDDMQTNVDPQTLRTMELRDAVNRARACHAGVLRGLPYTPHPDDRARLEGLADTMADTVQAVYDVCRCLERALDDSVPHTSEPGALAAGNGAPHRPVDSDRLDQIAVEAWRVISSALSDLELANQKATAARSSRALTEDTVRPLELELESRTEQLAEVRAALVPYAGEHDRSHVLRGS